jgi:hypothetical protein
MGEVMEGATERLPDVHVRLSPEVHGLLKALLEGALRRRMARVKG